MTRAINHAITYLLVLDSLTGLTVASRTNASHISTMLKTPSSRSSSSHGSDLDFAMVSDCWVLSDFGTIVRETVSVFKVGDGSASVRLGL